ncbi:S1C family serine protease [Aneurinibacillus aneurinilyticus]|uniref:Serine protease do-like protein n=1 Tax=Aneurinibacillus aneurinilyticus ATCC 12856 TaxID=649747 RepID=U1XB90_ANEAE|nr:trypsin-like peptidase domain-containing protein [Aneurinibacillus aneurinilyticus]ERI11803.1 serine protease do-like protein [Aneurinibacillus aneurinilyticus ATCC 12856]MED0709775.1 trypsin-like peptidase domain-containing protein [Aneurinibacillus aneurinilyticus]MED0725342.1 trypsin-like peptidase domain-containing protein [Aneurinibacillus aneurinilyticus]MED0735379.1 trypsin-like peptidase domain-containing protein [Aneurinibacillus aneurinilyticus]MED0744300.1 trypsin-like peptidase 
MKSENIINAFLFSIIGGVITAFVFLFCIKQGIIIPSNTEDNIKIVKDHEVSLPKSQNDFSTKVMAAVEKNSETVVGIVNIKKVKNLFTGKVDDVEQGVGSGIIFKKERDKIYVVTNNHVVENSGELEICLSNGKKVQATLKGKDTLTDLAVLEFTDSSINSIAAFGNSDDVKVGQLAIAIGNPLGIEFSKTVTQGIISAKKRNITVDTELGEWDINVIQTDAAINPGNSGGPLINEFGEVIGINSMKIVRNGVEGLGFAIPINDAIPIINELLKGRKVERPYIGIINPVDLKDIPDLYKKEIFNLPDDLEDGILINGITPYSLAEKYGLKKYDVITEINKSKVSTLADFKNYLYTKVKVGDEIELTIYRKNVFIKIKILLSKALD